MYVIKLKLLKITDLFLNLLDKVIFKSSLYQMSLLYHHLALINRYIIIDVHFYTHMCACVIHDQIGYMLSEV